MSIINSKRLRKNENKRVYNSKKDNTIHKYIYNTGTWKALRLEYLRLNPLCEECKSKGKIMAASEVHHIIPISTGKNINEKQTLGLDWNNLMSLCDNCHKIKHLQRNYQYFKEYQERYNDEK